MTIRVTMALIAFFTIGNINSASAEGPVTVTVPVPTTTVTTNTSNEKASVTTVPVPVPTISAQVGSSDQVVTQLPSLISIVPAPVSGDQSTSQQNSNVVVVTPPTPGVKSTNNPNNEKSTKQVTLSFQTSEKNDTKEPVTRNENETVVERDDLETLPPAQPAEIQAVTTEELTPSPLWGLLGFIFGGALLGLGAFTYKRQIE